MIYTNFGSPVTVIRAEWRADAPNVPGWCVTLLGDDGHIINRFAAELRADGGYKEIDEACKAKATGGGK